MMPVEYQITIAFLLDFIMGDPRWFPHPVKIIGRAAIALEKPMRVIFRNTRFAGVMTAFTIIAVSAGLTTLLLFMARQIHPFMADVLGIIIIYTTLAARDLQRHSIRVFRALKSGDLPEARKALSMLVGRDTEELDEPQIVRGVVESVAENLVDGVTAPLFFAIIGGPVGAIIYKAINTLDSTFGYKTPRYLLFGWASARIDDLANWLPARLTTPCIVIAAALMGKNFAGAVRIARRDGLKHDSPNSGISEAAFAGALGVQLGGLNYYNGEAHYGQLIGDSVITLDRYHIRKANTLMYLSAILFGLIGIIIRMAFFSIIG
ncbi:MAG TPA: adenosylcobinamide-phosphate synthase CbiB [Chitinispirillaceae bacterium]|nr:adenosylcobinamide-phosphate synthase CbiB [Chitinispirillaceae bacterium]